MYLIEHAAQGRTNDVKAVHQVGGIPHRSHARHSAVKSANSEHLADEIPDREQQRNRGGSIRCLPLLAGLEKLP